MKCIFITLGIQLFLGCSLADPDSINSSPALTLTSESNLSLTTLRWDPVRVTGFKEYVILQSPNPIGNAPTPVVNADVTVVQRIKEVEQTSISLSLTLFTPQVYYKLYCAVDDRFLYSQTLCIQQSLDVINGFYDRGCHAVGENEMVLFDRINDRLSTYNYTTGQITKTVSEQNMNFPSMQLSIWSGGTDVFSFDQSPAWIRKYSYPSLLPSSSKNFNQVLWAANVHNQFVFVASEESNKNFQVLNRSNLNVIDSRAGISGNQNVAVFPGNPITVITLGTGGSKLYQVDDNGKVILDQVIDVNLFQPDQQSVCAQGMTLFIAGQNGTIINREGEFLGNLNTKINSFISIIRLSQDETTAAYVVSDNISTRLEVVDVTKLPTIIKLKEFTIPSLNYSDLIIRDDIIYLIGASFVSSAPQTITLKYPR